MVTRYYPRKKDVVKKLKRILRILPSFLSINQHKNILLYPLELISCQIFNIKKQDQYKAFDTYIQNIYGIRNA